MNITFALEVNTSKNLKGESSILIRCTKNRKHRRIGTGISVSDIYWNKSLQKIKRSHPLAIEYNNILQNKMKQVLSSYNNLLEKTEEVDLCDIIDSMNNGTKILFFDFAKRTKIEQIKATNKLGTLRRYEAVLNKFRDYSGASLNINQVTYSMLHKYELYLLNTLKNGRDTVSSNMSVLRAVINEAIRHGVYKQNNPFEQIKLKYTDNTKEKLTAQELYKVFNQPLPVIPSLILARDFFLACFLSEGTRGGDMVAMQKENIVNNCLVFNQQKTGKQMVIPISEALMTILTKYINKGSFIFPLLKDDLKVDEIVINSKLTYVNKYLKELAKYCGIFKNLSTHVARHTFTDLALQVTNGNIYQVQQSLGHSSIKTTEIYSRQRLNYLKPSLMPDIIQYINKVDIQ